MDQASLLAILKSAGLPVAYHHYDDPPAPPYVVYLFADSNNFGADNKVYVKSNRYLVELYTTKKDLEAEQRVEDVLNAAEIYYDKSEGFIESEKMYQVVYEIEV